MTGRTACLLSSAKGKRLSIVFLEHGGALITVVDGTNLRSAWRVLAQVDDNPPFAAYAHLVEPHSFRVDRNDQLLAEMARGNFLVIRLAHEKQSVEEKFRLPLGMAAGYRRCLGL